MKSMIDCQFTSFDSGLAKTIKWYQENLN